MTETQIPLDELQRQELLNDLAVLDTEPEALFDSLVRVVSQLAGSTISMINFVATDRIWVKAADGTSCRQMARQTAFCNETIKQSEPLIIESPGSQERFEGNPFVSGTEQIGFYAGFPLELSGSRIGTLCVMNPVPLPLSEGQISALSDLASSVSELLSNRLIRLRSKARERILAKLSREVPGFIYQFQLHPDNSVSIPFATRAIDTIYDIEKEEVLANADKSLDRIHRNDRDGFIESMYASARTLETWRREYRVVIPSVGVRWREGHATPERLEDGSTLWHGYVSDITDRKAIELDALRSREQAALATRAASVSIIRWDAGSRLVTLDGLAKQHFAVQSADQTISQDDWLSRLDPADKERCEPLMRNAVRNSESLALEFQVVSEDGRVRDVVLHIGAEYGEPPEAVEIICASRDVTARREAQRQQRIADAAQQANAEKGRFLARVSHELRTPLNAIYGLSQVLNDDSVVQSDPASLERTNQIMSASEHLIRLIDDLLELTQAEAGENGFVLESINVDECVGRSLEFTKHLASEHQVQIIEAVRQTGLLVYANKRRLEQCLINLLSNAFKYNRSGGSVGVSVEAVEGRCKIHVNDTGSGLSATQLLGVFEPFNRTGAEFSNIPGSGLGLGISKRLIEQMGGSLSANSIVGVGSQFSLSLRAVTPDPSQAQQAPQVPKVRELEVRSRDAQALSASSYDGSTDAVVRTVLYVEDNALNRAVMRGFLDPLPEINLVLAETAEICLELLDQCQPDLLLVDIHLPDMNGKDLLVRIAAMDRFSYLPAIAVSADALPDDISAARQIGFIDYWIKPLKLAQVREALGGSLIRPVGLGLERQRRL